MTTTEFLEREIRRAEISLRHAQRKPNTPEEELRGLRDKIACLEEALAAVQGNEPARAHLDRDAWEPCEWCGEWIGFDYHPKEQDVGYRLYAGFCKQVAADDFWEDETENMNFCPICGRPLTDEAWAELERRVYGG